MEVRQKSGRTESRLLIAMQRAGTPTEEIGSFFGVHYAKPRDM